MKLLLDIFLTFAKLGCFSFGGGYAMIPLIEREVTENKKWLEKDNIVDVFAVAGALPGAIALNSSAFVGYNIAGIPGAIAALIGNLLPSVVITFALILLFIQNSSNEIVNRAFLGIRPAVVGLIAYASFKLGKTAVIDKITLAIAVLALAAALFFPSFPIPMLIVLGAVVGMVIVPIRNIFNRKEDIK